MPPEIFGSWLTSLTIGLYGHLVCDERKVYSIINIRSLARHKYLRARAATLRVKVARSYLNVHTQDHI